MRTFWTIVGSLLLVAALAAQVYARGGGGHGGGGHHGGGEHHAAAHHGGEHHAAHHAHHNHHAHHDHHRDHHIDHHNGLANHYGGWGGWGWGGWNDWNWGLPSGYAADLPYALPFAAGAVGGALLADADSGGSSADYGSDSSTMTADDSSGTSTQVADNDSGNSESSGDDSESSVVENPYAGEGTNSSTQPEQVAETDQGPTMPANRGVVFVKLPAADAVVEFNGHALQGEGLDRVIYTPEIASQKEIAFEVKATWKSGEKTVTEVRKGLVAPGTLTMADFTKPTETQQTSENSAAGVVRR